MSPLAQLVIVIIIRVTCSFFRESSPSGRKQRSMVRRLFIGLPVFGPLHRGLNK